MKKVILLFTLCILSLSTYAKIDSLEIAKLSARLKNIEDYKMTIDKVYEAKHQELKNDQAKFEATYFQRQEWWHLLIAFFTGGGVIGIAYLRKCSKDMFEAQLKPFFEGKSELMQSIMEKYDKELSIRREKKILIVTSKSNLYVYTELKTTFKKDNITQEIFSSFNDELLEKIKKVDLVVFDNIKELATPESQEKNENLDFVKGIPNSTKIFIYKTLIKDLELLERVGSATLPTQVIPNIMNLLKYN